MLKKCKFCPFDKSSDLSYDLILEALLQINGWVKYKYNYAASKCDELSSCSSERDKSGHLKLSKQHLDEAQDESRLVMSLECKLVDIYKKYIQESNDRVQLLTEKEDKMIKSYEAQLLAWEKKEEPSSPPSAWISDQLHSADGAVARYCSPNTTTSDEMINSPGRDESVKSPPKEEDDAVKPFPSPIKELKDAGLKRIKRCSRSPLADDEMDKLSPTPPDPVDKSSSVDCSFEKLSTDSQKPAEAIISPPLQPPEQRKVSRDSDSISEDGFTSLHGQPAVAVDDVSPPSSVMKQVITTPSGAKINIASRQNQQKHVDASLPSSSTVSPSSAVVKTEDLDDSEILQMIAGVNNRKRGRKRKEEVSQSKFEGYGDEKQLNGKRQRWLESLSRKVEGDSGSDAGGKPFSCVVCGQTFSRKSSLYGHVEKHTKDDYLYDDLAADTDDESIVKKYSTMKKAEDEFFCDFCDRPFYQRSLFSKHMLVHNNPKKDSPSTAVEHTGDRMFSCTECGKSFEKKAHLVRHSASHSRESILFQELPRSPVASTTVKCHVCSESFGSDAELKLHLPSHENENVHSCSPCGERFASKSAFDEHMTGHTPGRFTCIVCGKICYEKGAYLKHTATHQRKGDMINCHICGKECWGKTGLRFHLTSHITGEKHVCNICNKEFPQKTVYDGHMSAKHGVYSIFSASKNKIKRSS